jgi:anti-anti-sigma factor
VSTRGRRPRRRPARTDRPGNGAGAAAPRPDTELPLDECGLLIVAEERDRLRLLRLSGVMDLCMLGAQEEELRTTIGRPPAVPVVIDLSGVLFCDCDGLGALVRAARLHPAGTGAVALAGPQPVVARLFTVMPPDPVAVFPTLAAAFDALG